MNGQQDLFEPTADNLHRILQRLRAPGGCPWDREQTRESLSRCLAEECAETLDEIDENNPPAICDELGDVLMNVIFQAVVAEERQEFTWRDVQSAIVRKMIRRHAHIFGEARAETAGEVAELWEKIKAAEPDRKPRESVLDGLPKSLSALNTAEKIQKKVAKYGFDWERQEQILDKISEELSEVREALAAGDDLHADEEIGDLLFAVVNLARFRKRRSPEELLRAANAKFARRFRFIETELKKQGKPLEEAGIDLLENLWQKAKSAE